MGLISDFITNVTAFRVKIGEKLLTLASRIGLLSSLTTVAKTDLVAAINEINSNTPNSYHKWFRLISPGYATTGVLRIDLGIIFTGYLKIHITGSFTNNNSNGYIEISGGLGANASIIWNNQLRCTTSIGQTRVNFYVDPVIKRDAISGQLYIEIHKKVAANNVFILEIEAFALSSFGSAGNTINPVLNAFDSATAPSALTNEVEIDGDINWNTGGLGLSLQGIRRLVFGSSNVILAGNTSGPNSIYFRPQGPSTATGQVIIDGNGQVNSSIHGNSSQWLQGYNERISQFNITYATNVYTFSVLLSNGVQKQATLQVSSSHFEINPSTGVLQLLPALATQINNSFCYVRGLTASDNLDSIIAMGLYMQTTSSNATLALNYPIAGHAGILKVFKTASTHMVQEYTPFINNSPTSPTGNRTYQRYFYNGIISTWRLVAYVGDNVSSFANDANYLTAATVGNGQLNFSVSSDFVGGAFAFSADQKTNVTPTPLSLSPYVQGLIADGATAYSYGNHANAGYATITYVNNAISNLKFVSRTYDATDVNNNDRYIGANVISMRTVNGFDVCVYNPADDGFISPFTGGSNLHNAFMGILGIQVGSDVVIKGAVQSQNDLSPFIVNNQIYFCLAYVFAPGGVSGVIQFMSMSDIYNHKANATSSEIKDVIIIGEIGSPDVLLLNQREV